jgi:iron transport multicopper oxidase
MYYTTSTFVLCAVAALVRLSRAATVTYNFNSTWVLANPDGLFTRPVQGINHQWPLPTIQAFLGDQVVVNLNNQLGNVSTSLHFHGLFQNGTTAMDGPVGSSQCSVPPGASVTYNFTVSPIRNSSYSACDSWNSVRAEQRHFN